jgi:hypothetical protein
VATVQTEAAQLSGRKNKSQTRADADDRKKAAAKLHPALQSALKCWESAKANGTSANCALVEQGRVKIQITLARKESDITTELQKLGFVRTSESPDGLTLTGSIAVEKLRALAALESVRYVTPGPLGRR